MKYSDTKARIAKISTRYFDYMAKRFPVMCLNDEFSSFPRAEKAIGFLDSLDSFDKDKIREDINYIKGLKASLEKLNTGGLNLEDRIDIALLGGSIATFLREFEKAKIWQIDPNIYIKIFLFGTDQLINRFSFLRRDIDGLVAARISQVPRLLEEAKENLKKVPYAYLDVALEMVDAARHYFKADGFFFNKGGASRKRFRSSIDKALESLDDFRLYLMKKSSSLSFIKERALIEDILTRSFSYKKGLDEIFDIASRSHQDTLRALKGIAKEIDKDMTWQEILSDYALKAKNADELLKAYSREILKIMDFVKRKGIITLPKTQKIAVKLTPHFMRPIRASASYSSPVTDDKREPAYFYVTPDVEDILHNEYKFVSAHETYPGHHLLDAKRRGLENPIRRQIESPLFYEGWASYAEELMARSGYIRDPRQRLLGLKRQAWRALRAMIDVGIRIRRLKYTDAEKLLAQLGYPRHMVKRMLRHYLLSPGYQLCYTIGKFEFDRLKEIFSGKCTLREFHDTILESGQIPFDLLEERLRERICPRSS